MSSTNSSKRVIRSAVTLSLVLAGLSFSGCSVIGLGIGSAIDSHSRHVSKENWRDPGEGKQIKVYCADGSIITGKFDSAGYQSTTEYNRRFELWRAGDSSRAALPSPGSQVTIDLVSGEQVTGEVVGYHRPVNLYSNQVQYERGEGSSGTNWKANALVVVKRSSNGATARFQVNLLKSVGSDSLPAVSSEQLRSLIVAKKAPELSSIAVSTETRRVIIPLDDIYRIDYGHSGHAKWIGLGVGLAIDAGMVALAIAMQDMNFGFGGGGGW